MDSVNSPAISGNSPSFAFNAASALDNESDQGDLFAAILSQTQTAPPQQQAPDPTNAGNSLPPQTAQQTPPAPPTQQPPQNNAPNFANNPNNTSETNSANNPSGTNSANTSNNEASTANNANVSNNTSDPDNDPKNNPNDANANTSSAASQTAGSPAGKSSRHHSRTDADKTSSNATGNTHSKSKSSTAVTVTSANQATNTAIPNSTTIDAVSSNGSQNGTNTDPATDTNTAPSTPGPAANANTASPNTAPAANSDPTLTAGLILNADPKTGSTTPAAGNDNNVDPTASANDPANNGVMPSQLMLLLMQLEHLAANQAATQTASTNLAVTADGQTSTTGGTQQISSGDQGKIDLKALMTAIAKMDNGTANNGSADLNGNDTTNTSSNVTPSQTATNSPQNAAPAWGNTSSNTDPKWINPDFLNLFSLPASNPVNPNAQTQTPILFNTGILTGTTAGGDGAALNPDTQGQTNTGVQDNALLSNNSSLPPATAPTQTANPYDFASELSALRATQGGSTGLPPAIDQVILQLSRNFSSNNNGSSQMSIQLRPAELGRVDVKLSIGSDGKVQGTVTADNPSTLNLLLKDVRGLERALQEAGLRADSGSLQFGLRGDGQPGGGSGQTAGNSSALADDAVSSSSTILPGFANSAETYYLTPGGVNMRV